jgi:alkanesulfonate monooxygenase SsuD/methylene tetrahydromethanopterin reductase-like flavin-dependent oxidoreductase (luciferase family)
MLFGVFDHLDRGSISLGDFYQARLRLIEAYDRSGFYAYHVAEHHGTPIGMAPSPNLFLSAVAERTRTLRFGPLVYALPLHHPLRLIEEICMLDQLSGGRLEIGFGRGASSIENSFFGGNAADAEQIYREALDIVLGGLADGKVNFRGEFFSFENVPLALEPLQKPHPPVWYGVHSVESAERAARRALNIVSLDSAAETRDFAAAYRNVWREINGHRPMPKIGISRFVVIAENARDALDAARRAYAVWRRSFYYLYSNFGGAPKHPRPATFDELMAAGEGIAGTPDEARDFFQRQMEESTATYLIGQFAFGDLSLDESLRSVELFTRRVMPAIETAGNDKS